MDMGARGCKVERSSAALASHRLVHLVAKAKPFPGLWQVSLYDRRDPQHVQQCEVRFTLKKSLMGQGGPNLPRQGVRNGYLCYTFRGIDLPRCKCTGSKTSVGKGSVSDCHGKVGKLHGDKGRVI